MEKIKSYFTEKFLGESIKAYIKPIAIFIVGVLVIILIKRFVLNKLERWLEKKEERFLNKILAIFIKNISLLLYLILLYISYTKIEFSKSVTKIVYYILIIFFTFFIIRVGLQLLSLLVEYYFKTKKISESTIKGFKGLFIIIKAIIWCIAFIFVLDNIGFKVTSVIAGFGIGGVAIALAAQSFLGDLFSYFSILFDKPFEVGDIIGVGDKLGKVIHIGLKTTRIKSLSGEELIFSNTELTSTTIHNYKKMEERRICFKIGVCYETPLEKLKKIPELIKEVIESCSDVKFDRAHFYSYGDFALIYEIVYYVLSNDYNLYMDKQHEINIKIKEAFEKEGIEFAYPTSTVYVYKK